MAYDNDDKRKPGQIEPATGAASLTQLYTDLKYLAGLDAGQTEVVLEAPPSAFYESKHATTFLLVKEFDSTLQGGSGVADIYLVAEDIQDPSVIEEEVGVTIRQAIEQIGVGAQELAEIFAYLALTEFGSTLYSTIDLTAIGMTGFVDSSITARIGPDGFMGVGLTELQYASYSLDFPSGTLNATDYKKNGVAINDWTEVLGAPNKVTWTGNAEAQRIDSTLATGTAPLTANSTTPCPGMDAEFHEGIGWHQGIQAHAFTAFVAADTTVGSLTLNGAAGSVWDITASVTVEVFDALDHNVKIKDGGGTQIGDTVTFKGVANIAQSVLVFGSYTATTGTETINATVGVPGGTGSNAEVTLVAHRVR